MDLISSKLDVFGIDKLRPFQEKVVKAYLEKKKHSSICYDWWREIFMLSITFNFK